MNNLLKRLTSNKSMVITLLAAFVLILLFRITSGPSKTQNQTKPTNNETTEITPSQEIKEKRYILINDSLTYGKQVFVIKMTGNEVILEVKSNDPNLNATYKGTYTSLNGHNSALLVNSMTETQQDPINIVFKQVDEQIQIVSKPDDFDLVSDEFTQPEPDLIDTKWYWIETQMNDGTLIKPNNKRDFSVSFAYGFKISTNTDCNNGNGAYYATQGLLNIPTLATTKIGCKESLESEFNRDLSEVSSYMIKGNKLILMLPYDSGSMVFEKAQD